METLFSKILEYPYYKHTVTNKEIKENFEKLKNYNLTTLPHPKNFIKLFQVNYFKDLEIYKITDFFTEDIRVKCHFLDNQSPFEYYQYLRNKSSLFQKKDLYTYKYLDDLIYNNCKLCSNFPITVSFEIYKFFQPKNVLDCSAGWGDRLISNIAYGKSRYTGIDPNIDLQDKYKKIIKFFGRSEDKYKVYKCGFEDFKSEDKWDLVFSSPPFFDLEIYSKDKSQSVNKYKTLKEWKEKFLFLIVKNSYNFLEKKGHLALYISDYIVKGKQIKYVTDTIEYAKSIGFLYKGVIAWKANKNVRKIYVFQK